MSALAPSPAAAATDRIAPRVLAAILLGTTLNPLNSSMIAVAIEPIRAHFAVGVVAISWLISSFYVVTAVGQGVVGRLADQLGPRRMLCAGFVLVGAASALGALAPSFGWLIAARMLVAVGTSAGFPAGLALLRNACGGGTPPPRTLAPLTIAGSATVATGPVVGGVLIALTDWQAIFYVNVVVAAVALPLALRWLPHDPQHEGGIDFALVRRMVDVPGIASFTLMLGSLLALLLSLAEQPLWWLAPVAVLAGAALVLLSRRREEPFLDVRVLAADRRLLSVFTQYMLVNLVSFGLFFALPIWLEGARGESPGTTGLLMTPLAGLAIVTAPIAARLLGRHGVRPLLVGGACVMVVGSLLLLTFGPSTPFVAIAAGGFLMGLPIGFNALGLQSEFYAVTKPEQTGAAGGLFQTFRFTGAVFSTSLIGIVFADEITTAGLHELAVVFAIVSAVVLAMSLARPASARTD